jgi:hydroxymethylpyrimidine pyrophosphatase-like HAD family hydrolase
MKHIAAYYNIPLERTVAIGDGFNDVEMLALAGKGVAMKNAHVEVKKHASEVTKYTNNEAGVGKYLAE